MNLQHLGDQDFICQLKEFILANLEDESLCVKHLAEISGMSPAAINQRLHFINGKHLSQFIRETRLEKALELLRNGTYTASEIAFQTGFGSPAYFNKCFREYFGYPPGKFKSIIQQTGTSHLPEAAPSAANQKSKKPLGVILLAICLVSIGIVAGTKLIEIKNRGANRLYSGPGGDRTTVAILPFRNLTNDTSWNIWQTGIQSCLISSLSASPDITVQNEMAVNLLLSNEGIRNYASLDPAVGKTLSKKAGAGSFVLGNILQSGATIRLVAELIESGSGKLISSSHSEGTHQQILSLVDSLTVQLHN